VNYQLPAASITQGGDDYNTAFDREMRELRLEKPMAKEYLHKIYPVLYRLALFPENPG